MGTQPKRVNCLSKMQREQLRRARASSSGGRVQKTVSGCQRKVHRTSRLDSNATKKQDIALINFEKLKALSDSRAKALRNSNRKLKRLEQKVIVLKADLKAVTAESLNLRSKVEGWNVKLSELKDERDLAWAKQLECTERTTKQKRHYQKLLAALQARVRCQESILSKSKSSPPASLMSRIRQKGSYTPAFRALIRMLVESGCSRDKLGRTTFAIARLFGVTIKHTISRRTIGRCILEGGVAAELQIGHEIAHSQGSVFNFYSKTRNLMIDPLAMTASCDSTTHRKTNIQSHYLAYRDQDGRHILRNFGVESTSGHSAERGHQTWVDKFRKLTDLYNRSPLAMRFSSKLSLPHIAKVLKGMNGDHANAEKAQVDLMESWKKATLTRELGEQSLASQPIAELIALLSVANERKLEAVGGPVAWESLGEDQQAMLNRQTMDQVISELGQKAYDSLPDDERREIDLFLWMGCCMHKSLNAFRGGNLAMMALWGTDLKAVEPPVLLANKSNAAVLRKILEPSKGGTPGTEDEMAAFEASTRGAAKTVAIAGAIFNNKDDKKGYHDIYLNYMEKYSRLPRPVRRFPGTSNTRFGSHGEAAAVLLADLDAHRGFMIYIRDRKKSPEWTNIELNIQRALSCPRTLEELCVFAFYTQAIDAPYMQQVRGEENNQINGLELGKLHTHVMNHIRKLIDRPALFLDSTPTSSSSQCTLHGEGWMGPLVIEAIYKHLHSGTIPHFSALLVAFLKGALKTWVRFSSEFESGSRIDLATSEERELAWVPATNDANEGSLGSYRVLMRKYPSLTMLQYNAILMYQHNDTASFVDEFFTEEEDYEFIRQEARARDVSGHEKKRKDRLLEDDERDTMEKINQRAIKQQKLDERVAALAAIPIVTALESVPHLTSIRLIDDQLDIHRELESWIEMQKPERERHPPLIPRKSNCGNRIQRERILSDAITRWHQRPAQLQINIFAARMAAFANRNGTNNLEPVAVAKDWEAEEDEEMEDL